jgi:hypothetical protein
MKHLHHKNWVRYVLTEGSNVVWLVRKMMVFPPPDKNMDNRGVHCVMEVNQKEDAVPVGWFRNAL